MDELHPHRAWRLLWPVVGACLLLAAAALIGAILRMLWIDREFGAAVQAGATLVGVLGAGWVAGTQIRAARRDAEANRAHSVALKVVHRHVERLSDAGARLVEAIDTWDELTTRELYYYLQRVKHEPEPWTRRVQEQVAREQNNAYKAMERQLELWDLEVGEHHVRDAVQVMSGLQWPYTEWISEELQHGAAQSFASAADAALVTTFSGDLWERRQELDEAVKAARQCVFRALRRAEQRYIDLANHDAPVAALVRGA